MPSRRCRQRQRHRPLTCCAAPLVSVPSPPPQVLKLAKKAAKRKQIKRGVKEVIKAIRKNVKGCVAAAAAASHAPAAGLEMGMLCVCAPLHACAAMYAPLVGNSGGAGCMAVLPATCVSPCPVVPVPAVLTALFPALPPPGPAPLAAACA